MTHKNFYMFKKLILAASALLGAFAVAFGQQLPELPMDPATRVGKLDNGMTYYIRHNANPAERAEFYLATNVGAIQEEPDQDGLAHFLEHMCFNGTKNFPGKDLLNWLQSIGASFGGNINASTGVEKTVYMLNNIPLVRPTVVDSCLLIIHDYAHFVTCDPEEIDKERGVIIEEKRSRNTASWRMFEASQPYYYGDSKYNGCTIIGSEENLRNFKPESLTNFYQTWYRPDLQAVIVVGDIDVDEVEAKIKDIFADIPAAVNPRPKDVIKIPDNSEPVIGILTDPENTSIRYEVLWKTEPTPEEFNSTTLGLMEDLTQDLIFTIMDERFTDLCSMPDAPFLSAGLYFSGLAETCDATIGVAVCKEDDSLKGFEAVMLEIERMKRFGFTDSEVARAKTELLSQYETAMNKAETRKNSEFIMPLMYHFFDNERYMEPATEYAYAEMILQQIGADMLNQIAAQLITPDNMVVVYTAPEREGLVHPTESQILDVILSVENAELERPEGEELPEAFLDPSELAGCEILKSCDGAYGSKVLELANGAKAVLLPGSNEKNNINIDFRLKGGRSLVSDEDLYSLQGTLWELYVRNTGIADFANTTVIKMLAGKQLSMSPFVSEYTHGISGTSTTKDFETAMQLAYLYFVQPRFDEAEYEVGITQMRTLLPNLESTPNWKLNKALYNTAYSSPRRFMLSSEALEKASLATLEKNYRELFKDAAGLTVYIVGDFELEEAVALVQKYVGSLPKGDKATDWSYCNDGYVSGKVVNDFTTTMATPLVSVARIYHYDKPFSIKDEVTLSALDYILDMVYTRTLREEEGGTYGASTYASASMGPHPAHSLMTVFQTNEEMADNLNQMAYTEFLRVAEEGPTEEDFNNAVRNLEKTLPENKVRNSFWSSALRYCYVYGIEDYVGEYEAAIKALTPEMVKEIASDFLESGNSIEIIMRPEATAETAE